MKMNMPAKKILQTLQDEVSLAALIPYAYLLNEHTVETKSGHLLQVIKLEGIAAETLDPDWIDYEKTIRNTLWKSIADSSIAIYFHTIRKKENALLNGQFKHYFAEELNTKWQSKQARSNYYVNEHYITLVKKPPIGSIRGIGDFFRSLFGKFNATERERYRQNNLNDLTKISQRLIAAFSHYEAKKLGFTKSTVNKDTQSIWGYSELLSFLAYLINIEPVCFAPLQANLAASLGKNRLFFDTISGTIAIRRVNNESRFGAMLSIKEYAPETSAGMLDKLLDVPGEVILTQSFSFLDKNNARSKIKEQQRNQIQSDDGITCEIVKINDSLDDLGSSEAVSGQHHFTLFCHADSKEQLENLVVACDATLNQLGIIAVREDRGVKAAFFAMLPANQAYIARRALVSSKNMAGFASFHNSPMGQKQGNYWGEAVTVLETISGSPYYFNFHVQDVANTILIGPQGSGKTLLEAFLLAQSMKHGGRIILFDKDQGLEAFVRAMDGQYSLMTPGAKTGFAPFQMPDTPENRHFLVQLLRKIALLDNRDLNDEELQLLHTAVAVNYQLPQHERLLRNLVPNLGPRKVGSLRNRFDQWVEQGDYAWVFDNNVDQLSLNAAVIGFDMTSVLDDHYVLAPVYSYLFHRIEQLLDGTPTRIVVAEGWKPLQQDATFRAQIKDWSSTPRKKEAFLILDTQSPQDISHSEVGCKIIQESVTQIYFANPKAQYEDYVLNFKLSEKEFEIIKTLEKGSHYFLLKQGKNSVVARANLSGFTEMAVLSGRKKYQPILKAAIQIAGHEAKNWLPHYYAGIAALENQYV